MIQRSGRSVIIVSRDNDYGLNFEEASHLNEWLREEFTERAGVKSQITLNQFLYGALKEVKIEVTKEEEEAEEKLVALPKHWWESVTAADFEKAFEASQAFFAAIAQPSRQTSEAIGILSPVPAKQTDAKEE